MKLIQLTNEEYEVVKRRLKEMLDKAEDKAEEKEWEPPRGSYFIAFDNTSERPEPGTRNSQGFIKSGRARATQKLAERAANASRIRDRLEAHRDEFFPHWVDTEEFAYSVCMTDETAYVELHSTRFLGAVYGPREWAVMVVEWINSGRLKL